jgi:hypothetical protein
MRCQLGEARAYSSLVAALLSSFGRLAARQLGTGAIISCSHGV